MLLLVFSACHQTSDREKPHEKSFPKRKAVKALKPHSKTNFQTPSCQDLKNKKILLAFANKIIKANDNPAIWNLSEIDAGETFSIEDYFTNLKTKDRLVLMKGEAGLSAGSATYLLMLFRCSDKNRLIRAEQSGPITKKDIRDLNGDGIKEIISSSEMMWMGECNNSYSIFNFKGGRRNLLYSALSRSTIDCGFPLTSSSAGDTLENQNENKLIGPDENKHYRVSRIRTIKISRGGKTEQQILKNLRTLCDTTITTLK
jgi:hypothetical protein